MQCGHSERQFFSLENASTKAWLAKALVFGTVFAVLLLLLWRSESFSARHCPSNSGQDPANHFQDLTVATQIIQPRRGCKVQGAHQAGVPPGRRPFATTANVHAMAKPPDRDYVTATAELVVQKQQEQQQQLHMYSTRLCGMQNAHDHVAWNATLHKALRLGILPDGSGPAAAAGSRWRKGSVAVVVAAFSEFDAGVPRWLAAAALEMQSKLQPVLYQRSNSSMPNYAPNVAYEAGVYLQFVRDFYHDLPDVTAFVQAHAEEHSPNFLCMLECVSTGSASYISLNSFMIHQRSTALWRRFYYAAWVEQCWRDIANMTGAPFAARYEPTISAPCCAQFIASRQQLRRRAYAFWLALYHKTVGGNGICHKGPLDLQQLAITHQIPVPEHVNFGPEQVVDLGKHTLAGAIEHLSHVIFGFQPHLGKEPKTKDHCSNFHAAAVCPGSPCVSAVT